MARLGCLFQLVWTALAAAALRGRLPPLLVGALAIGIGMGGAWLTVVIGGLVAEAWGRRRGGPGGS